MADRRKVRQDIIVRTWGSESELTRLAYENISKQETQELVVNIDGQDEKFKGGLKQLKDEIISLKLNRNDDERLRNLIGAFSNQVTAMKEQMIMKEMEKMDKLAEYKQSKLDEQVNSDVVPIN